MTSTPTGPRSRPRQFVMAYLPSPHATAGSTTAWHRVLSIGVGLILSLSVTHSLTHATGDVLILNTEQARCVINTIQGSFSPIDSTYQIAGVCSRFKEQNPSGTSTFGNEIHLGDTPWTAEGKYDIGTHAVHERIMLSTGANRLTLGLESTMVCPQDPWLNRLTQPCTNIVDVPGAITETILRVLRRVEQGIPFTSSITTDRRTVLNKEYQASRASLPKSKPPTAQYRANPPAVGALKPGIAPMMLAPPKLVSPIANNRLLQGTVLVKLLRSLGGRAEVEFTWLDQPPLPAGVVPETKTWLVPMDELAAGVIVPAEMTARSGHWQIRVRKSLTEAAPWSEAVPFQIVLAQSQQQPSSQQQFVPKLQGNTSQSMQQQPLAGQPKTQADLQKLPAPILRRGVDDAAESTK
ncbi:MAG: hypothetical protein QM771_10720 [Nitrospira sp.]